jgi:hypothetical protein
MVTLNCYVVTREKKAAEPLFVAVDLDPARSFSRAKSFVLAYNATNETGRTVIRRGSADLQWDQTHSEPLTSAS